MSLLDSYKNKMQAAVDHLKEELKGIRTGRANPAMLDGITVEVYGTRMRLKDISSITAPETRLLLITPFDPQNAPLIGKAIEKGDIGFQPIVDGNAVRIKIPSMDEAMRKEMVKLCHKLCEDVKIRIRGVRREANEFIRKQKSSDHIPEDVMKKLEKEVQDCTDKFCKDAEDCASKKEKEVTTI